MRRSVPIPVQEPQTTKTLWESNDEQRRGFAFTGDKNKTDDIAFATLYGTRTKNRLYLSNFEIPYSCQASYLDYKFLGRPEKHLEYQNSETNDFSISFKLFATIAYKNKNPNPDSNTWRADYNGTTNDMDVSDIYNCSNWLASATRPTKSSPPERLVLVAGKNYIKFLDVVISSFSKKIIEEAGYDKNTIGGNYDWSPKGLDISLGLKPIFDLKHVPFNYNIIDGNYGGIDLTKAKSK